jgi:hypothetical protein
VCLQSGKYGNFDKPNETNELIHFCGKSSAFQLPNGVSWKYLREKYLYMVLLMFMLWSVIMSVFEVIHYQLLVL